MMRTLSIGITGGIGSGKSEVGKIFSSLGVKRISADEVAKQLMETDGILKKRIQQAFGRNLYSPEGRLDRKRMAFLIFGDESAREKLNGLVHPATLGHIKKELDDDKKSNEYPLVIVEAALLYEAHAEKMFDYVIAVVADEELRMKRVMQRDSVQKKEVLLRMKSQSIALEKIEDADFIIMNSGSMDDLTQKCVFIFSLLKKIAQSG